MVYDVQDVKTKVPPGTKPPAPPPVFGGSVLGGSDASKTGAPASEAGLARPKRKVSIVQAPASKSAAPKAPLSAQDLSASALQQLGVGGLDTQLEDLFRRAFASRLVPASVAKQMGISHVKGILLYGPPGTGKTLIARQLAHVLAGGNREPEVINGPELLQRWVGQSEANIRMLFEKAEEEYRKKGDAADLHVLIFDEVDALCKVHPSVP